MGKVIVSGEGGQGVRVISHVLASLLVNIGYRVSLLYDYDSQVRGGMSLANLIFSREPIDNPVIDEADILLELSDKAGGIHARKTVCQTGLCTGEEIPFSELGVEKFGNEIFGNMIALGRLLALINLDVSDAELADALPIKYRQENIDSVHFGYRMKEEDLHRGIQSRKIRRFHYSSEHPIEPASEKEH